MKLTFRHSIFLLFPLILSSCGGPKKLTTDQTFLNLQPVEQLPVYDLESVPVNFEVVIKNVADMGSSYKNRAAFYINDYLILPDNEITNVQNEYVYRLKLKPGIYDIRGEYFALDGFSERKYEIKPQTKVMVKPETVTKVYYTIEKNWDGTPLYDKMIFNVSYTPQKAKVKPPEIGRKKPVSRPVNVERRYKQPKRIKILPGPAPEEQMITLTIKTAPASANVFIDDEFIGKSPVRVMIDRANDHEIRIAKRGYESVLKYLDHGKFGREKSIHLIQKLIPR